MLVIAGYLNYRNDSTNAYDIEVSGIMDNNLGDAVFVDSNNLITTTDDILEDLSQENLKHTSAEFFSDSRINRNNTYAEQLETYQNIVKEAKNENAQIEFAKNEIKRINDEKKAISTAESLIKLKGIEDVVILINNESVNVVVLEEKLTEEIIAKVQNIVENEIGAKIENIHISSFTKNK